jgi:1-carboxybiuret hydrolase subunit AtzG-like protein
MKRKAVRKAKAARPKRPRPARAAAKAKREDSINALVTANAQALGLTLDPAWHHSIAFNLHLILRHAALVDEFALPDDAEPAPVFHA